jgi:hypothetical protein
MLTVLVGPNIAKISRIREYSQNKLLTLDFNTPPAPGNFDLIGILFYNLNLWFALISAGRVGNTTVYILLASDAADSALTYQHEYTQSSIQASVVCTDESRSIYVPDSK